MFADFLKRLTAPAPEPLNDTDARLALGALLVRLARADGHYDQQEVAQITSILATRYGLDDTQAVTLRSECETLETEAPDTVRFTRAIKDAVPYDDRLAVIKSMWQIVLTDGARDDAENAMMRMVAPMLGITDQESHAARLALSK